MAEERHPGWMHSTFEPRPRGCRQRRSSGDSFAPGTAAVEPDDEPAPRSEATREGPGRGWEPPAVRASISGGSRASFAGMDSMSYKHRRSSISAANAIALQVKVKEKQGSSVSCRRWTRLMPPTSTADSVRWRLAAAASREKD